MTTNNDERLLVLSAQPADARLVCEIAGEVGISAQPYESVDELCTGILEGAGVAVIAQEALRRGSMERLETVLKSQPAWSDLPLIVIAVADADPWADDVLGATADLGNVVVLQRPLRIATLVTALRAALRARARQYEVRRSHELLQEALHRESARAGELEAIMQAVPIATFIARDPECRNMFGNRMTYDLLRLAPGSNLSKSAPEGESPTSFKAMKNGREIPAQELPAQRAAATGQAIRHYEFDLVFEDGTRRHLLGDAVPMFDEQGRPSGAVGAFVDITERKRNEEQMRQAQKLESVGLLAAGIAHDFNNILTGIMGNASLILEEVGPGPAERLKEVISGAERAANLTRQLLAYSGKGQFVVRELDVSRAVHEMSELVQFSIPKSVDLALNLRKRLPKARMDPGQLQQLVMNLIINAGEAIGEGNPGRITISTDMPDLPGPFVDALGQVIEGGRFVSIEVSDTGAGISEETRAKIFDPFFTTKFLGRGLGLAAVAGIVRAQKGAITINSAPQGGSTFRVFLPVVGSGEQPCAQEPALQGRATVLVVDDESSVRDFIGAVLRREGYRVLLASDGRDALAVCEQENARVDAAILDIVMPRMGANDLLPELKARQPQLRVLLTSGYSEAEARRLCAAYPGASFIQKPYTAQQVASAVEDLLGAVREPRALGQED